MKLFGSTKQLTDQTKNGENAPGFEVVEVVYSSVTFVTSYWIQDQILYKLLLKK